MIWSSRTGLLGRESPTRTEGLPAARQHWLCRVGACWHL